MRVKSNKTSERWPTIVVFATQEAYQQDVTTNIGCSWSERNITDGPTKIRQSSFLADVGLNRSISISIEQEIVQEQRWLQGWFYSFIWPTSTRMET